MLVKTRMRLNSEGITEETKLKVRIEGSHRDKELKQSKRMIEESEQPKT